MIKELLTHSRQQAFKTCRKKAWFGYEIGLRRTTDAKALRMGTAGHDGVECLGKGGTLDEAIAVVRSHYDNMPQHFDEYDWLIECETVERLICGYQWRWQSDGLTYIVTEHQFRDALKNPKTGGRSKKFDRSGKIDGIVQLEDGRLAVKESKFLGEDIGTDADLWLRLRMDHQITLYVDAARSIGYDVDTVLYDVVRKPSIKPEQVAIVDENGDKVVVDCNGVRVLTKQGKPRQTADKEQGYILQQRPMTPEEWGEKLNNDIGVRPDFYYARREIPRLEQQIAEYRQEFWDIAQAYTDAKKSDAWYRTVSKDTCAWCSYFQLCSNGWTKNDPTPEGFEILTNIHPELI